MTEMKRPMRTIQPFVSTTFLRVLYAVVLFAAFATAQEKSEKSNSTPARTINITADKDSRFKIDGKANATLRMKAGEHIHLHITAFKAKNADVDGAIHGFALLRAKDRLKVPGWRFDLDPGEQDFDLIAPEAGEYIVVCTVICSDQHEQMTMKVVVTR